MKVGIMQPYFFPYIGYWQLMNAVDKYVIYDDVNYIKSGWINRNNILINEEVKLINLRLSAASSNKLINEVETFPNGTYKKKILKTIKQSYSKAPYFEEVFTLLNHVINDEEKNLARYLTKSINEVCEYLKIDTEIIISSDIKKDSNLRAQDKVIEICKLLSAEQYINAIGGRNLYSVDDFLKEGIELKFLKTNEIYYKQFTEEKFIPNLSIIDVMMFNKPEEIKGMLNEFELL